MATANPFDILGDDDNEDPSQLVAAVSLDKTKKAPATAQQGKPAAKMPSKPLPPAQAVREARNESGRGRGRGGGRGFVQGHGGGRRYEQDLSNSEGNFGGNDGFSGGYSRRSEESESGKPFERRGGGGGGPRGPFRGGRRGDFSNGDVGEGERPRRVFDRRSGTGRGTELKREGSGRGNWGTSTDEFALEVEEAVVDAEKTVAFEKQSGVEEGADASKENVAKEAEEEPEPEDKEMTLDEYEKVLEEKRKALLAMKTQQRKVELDKELKSMQQLSNKKSGNEIFIKLGSEKDKHRDSEKEEKAKKSVSINEFLKPAEGERYYSPGGRGRGRGRGQRGGRGTSFGGGYASNAAAPSIEDPGQFPSLGGK